VSLRRWLLLGAVVVVVAAGVGVWWVFFRDDAPSAVDIDEAAQTAEEASTETTAPGADLTGTWEVDPTVGSFSNFTSSYVGYRVREELGGIGAHTAVGRTPDVTGTVEVEGATANSASFAVDMTTLQSDEVFRDQQMHIQGLETDQFPDAGFEITEPIELEGLEDGGAPLPVTAAGRLSLHGEIRDVELPLEVVLTGDLVAITGQLDVAMADYAIDPPTSFRVLSVEDHGVLELQLFLRRT
jgi:polyisoprenoid-binding protein YceI